MAYHSEGRSRDSLKNNSSAPCRTRFLSGAILIFFVLSVGEVLSESFKPPIIYHDPPDEISDREYLLEKINGKPVWRIRVKFDENSGFMRYGNEVEIFNNVRVPKAFCGKIEKIIDYEFDSKGRFLDFSFDENSEIEIVDNYVPMDSVKIDYLIKDMKESGQFDDVFNKIIQAVNNKKIIFEELVVDVDRLKGNDRVVRIISPEYGVNIQGIYISFGEGRYSHFFRLVSGYSYIKYKNIYFTVLRENNFTKSEYNLNIYSISYIGAIYADFHDDYGRDCEPLSKGCEYRSTFQSLCMIDFIRTKG